MVKKQKRKRGAQPGNRNAVTHGFYAKSMNSDEQYEFTSASELEGLDEEITLIRAEIKKALATGDEKYLKILVKGAVALDKLIRTRYIMSATNKHSLKDAVNNVVHDILIPLGVNIGSDFLIKKL